MDHLKRRISFLKWWFFSSLDLNVSIVQEELRLWIIKKWQMMIAGLNKEICLVNNVIISVSLRLACY
jgi:hypothetical protein